MAGLAMARDLSPPLPAAGELRGAAPPAHPLMEVLGRLRRPAGPCATPRLSRRCPSAARAADRS
ncbi:hypothetical protein LNQ03_08230 [Klebsiella pneumoniae subsp. pneumoniae]|nr:hypothetical protein [Klebsiella pneumoniae subsp. pneumoniae]